MNSPSEYARMSALAYLYDNLGDLPAWFSKLTPGQLQDIASVMMRWRGPDENPTISELEEIERQEVLRVVALCGGNVKKAAQALNIGRTTIYRKLKHWGYAIHNRMLQAQASVLAKTANGNSSTSKSR